MKYYFDAENHVHTLDGKPLYGVSTVTNVISKPITWWASGMAVGMLGWIPTQEPPTKRMKAAMEMQEEIKAMDGQQYLELLDKAYRAHDASKKSSAVKGTDLHAELEKYIKWQILRKPGLPMLDERIKPFIEWSNLWVDEFILSEGHCFDEELWIGGICDCVVRMRNGKYAVIDFKSSKEAYFSHFVQCGGYVTALEKNGWFDANGSKVGILPEKIREIIVCPFGAKKFKPVKGEMLVKYFKKSFEGCLAIHKYKTEWENGKFRF